ncbi:MAG TPA: cytochrome c peroxidase [Gemmatimonadales bacterium]|nr:cytochrome c peroxidase [Gemmatimonadales bacterium]
MRFPVYLGVVALVLAGCGDGSAGLDDVDTQVRDALAQANVTRLSRLPANDAALVRLGQALMFDKILSGNRDVSCATCHNPRSATTDNLSLSIGTGGSGSASARILGSARQFNPRNSQELFNRGYPEFARMFWDGRVSSTGGQLETPAGASLPPGLASSLAAQAMFPVTIRHEMRGQPGDLDRFGSPNELAELSDDDMPAIWAGIMARVLAIPEYVAMFEAAYPGVPVAELGFQHAANAIAAFTADAFTTVDSPLDRYLGGDASALGEAEKRGAILFFGNAKCGSCHLGPHLTDQLFHSIAVPQVGPGMTPNEPEDRGRERVTASAADRFQFRTPPLRNVELTGPWMHDGAYTTLEGAVRHYIDVELALRNYSTAQLREDLRATYLSDPTTLDAMAASIDSRVQAPLTLSDAEVADLVSFLRSLTDPAAADLAGTIPAAVPSGLPVDD